MLLRWEWCVSLGGSIFSMSGCGSCSSCVLLEIRWGGVLIRKMRLRAGLLLGRRGRCLRVCCCLSELMSLRVCCCLCGLRCLCVCCSLCGFRCLRVCG